jgi:hypothetical protein
VSRDQAKLLWDTAKAMVQKSPDLSKTLGIAPAAHSIYQTRSGSKCVALSLDAWNQWAISCSERTPIITHQSVI